jgi:hypothetical protein
VRRRGDAACVKQRKTPAGERREKKEKKRQKQRKRRRWR